MTHRIRRLALLLIPFLLIASAADLLCELSLNSVLHDSHDDYRREEVIGCEVHGGNYSFYTLQDLPRHIQAETRSRLLRNEEVWASIAGGVQNDDDGSLSLLPSSGVSFVNPLEGQRRRKLSKSKGIFRIIMLRIIAEDSEPDFSADELYNLTFVDEASLRGQMAACSFGQLKIEPTKYGVLNVPVALKARGTPHGQLVAEAYRVAKTLLTEDVEDVRELVEGVMLIVPPGTKGGWAAFGSFNGKQTSYNNKWGAYLGATMHEIGHNLGLLHANENGLEYEGTTGYMGTAPQQTHFPRKCYNGQNNWHLGWYSDHQLEIDFSADTIIRPRVVRVATFVDYDKIEGDMYAIVKVGNLYMQYNRATKFNVDTSEKKNMLVIVEDQNEVGTDLLAGLDWRNPLWTGSVENKRISVEVCTSVDNASPNYIEVSIGQGETDCSHLYTEPPTPTPTRSPTRTPTRSPTFGPTHVPTARPTVSPTDPPTVLPTRSDRWPERMPFLPPAMRPTRQPTTTPTSKPTGRPTHSPTQGPTHKLTLAPIASPTAQPFQHKPFIDFDSPSFIWPTISPNWRSSSETSDPTLAPSNQIILYPSLSVPTELDVPYPPVSVPTGGDYDDYQTEPSTGTSAPTFFFGRYEPTVSPVVETDDAATPSNASSADGAVASGSQEETVGGRKVGPGMMAMSVIACILLFIVLGLMVERCKRRQKMGATRSPPDEIKLRSGVNMMGYVGGHTPTDSTDYHKLATGSKALTMTSRSTLSVESSPSPSVNKSTDEESGINDSHGSGASTASPHDSSPPPSFTNQGGERSAQDEQCSMDVSQGPPESVLSDDSDSMLATLGPSQPLPTPIPNIDNDARTKDLNHSQPHATPLSGKRQRSPNAVVDDYRHSLGGPLIMDNASSYGISGNRLDQVRVVSLAHDQNTSKRLFQSESCSINDDSVWSTPSDEFHRELADATPVSTSLVVMQEVETKEGNRFLSKLRGRRKRPVPPPEIPPALVMGTMMLDESGEIEERASWRPDPPAHHQSS